MKLRTWLGLLLLGSLYSFPCRAEVYKWVDEQGTVHYSSKAPNDKAKPAKLPPITRGDVKLSEVKLVSCDQHGGINCQLGADGDGSVICYDGFRDASARYRFTCTSPKLEVTDISELGPDGNFTVFVRNAKSVVATKPTVMINAPNNQRVPLSGPEEIPPFGMAEFTFQPQPGIKLLKPPAHEQISLACANCP